MLLYQDESYKIRGSCFEVWNEFGGAFKEKVIEKSLERESSLRGLKMERQKRIRIFYKNKNVGIYVPDFVIDNKIIVEIKVKPLLVLEDRKQFWRYLRGSEYRLGFLVNFGTKKLEIMRRVYDSARTVRYPRASASIIMIENIAKKEKALLIVSSVRTAKETWTEEEIAAELKNLVESTGIEVVEVMIVHLKEISAGRYIGKGKAEEITELVQGLDVNVVIFNSNLTATQQRNLEDIIGVKTIDRTQLILDIFAAHAHTQEGSLQVELAQLEYLLPRLRGKGIMLSRLGGGIGTRGPGEKKLEIDRRRIAERITRLKKELTNVGKHRDTIRKKRQKEQVKICSLVGYTNAGKSTLLNTLTGEHRETSNSLFTTLDPISRIFTLENHLQIVIADTVGFIYRLPPHLIESFKATLEELQYADLLLHVVDVSNENYPKLIKAVDEILNDLTLNEKHQLLIFNKIDELDEQTREHIQVKYPEAILISALKQLNLSELLDEIQKILFADSKTVYVTFPFTEMKLLDWLYKHAQVLKVEYNPDQVSVKVIMNCECLSSLTKRGVEWKEC